jgi:Uma2 family endonuclease
MGDENIMATVSSTVTSPALLDEHGDVAARPPFASDDRFYEVIDGRIVKLPPMGVYEIELAYLLAKFLDKVVEPNNLGKVIPEALFWIDHARKRKRRPDLAFVSARKWPAGKRVPRGETWDIIPDLAVEVVSESNGANEIIIKLSDYFKAGVQQVWVVYPEPRQVYVYTSVTSVQILPDTAVLDGGNLIPGFQLALAELFGDAPESDAAEPTSV